MSKHQRFRYRSLEDLQTAIQNLNVDIPLSTDLSVLGSSLTAGGFELSNRFAVHPMEGFDADENGAPGELAFRRYRRYASGGSALIWFEATAVVPEGRSNPGQFHISKQTVNTFRQLVDATHQAARDAGNPRPMLVLQLTHSGRYSKPAGVPAPIIAHRSPVLDPVHELPDDYPVISDAELDALQERFVEAAELAKAAGFDAVDVKSCHRYLVAELHASHTREGKYGGSLENRSRFLRETLARIRDRVDGLAVTTRLNAYDAISYPYGFGVSREDFRIPDLSEPVQLVGELRDIGIPMLNLSIGNPYFNPHYGRPYDFPVAGGTPPDEHPLVGIGRFLDITRQIQQAHPELPVLGSGYSWLRQFMPHVAAAVLQKGWASLIGQGRGAFAYPDSVNDILRTGKMDPTRVCVTCSGCTQIMRDGGQTGCVVRDSEIYGPKYREARRFSIERLRKEVERCRDCVEATCSHACPAHIDIPRFLKAFADGDIGEAYATLKEKNVLPEMCGFICPASEQCEGGCLEDIFCRRPLPIQDIQLVVARAARLQGIVGVDLPEQSRGQRVAVVGGGPAGLACTITLLEFGYDVEIFEKSDCLGGVPDASIPEMRYGNAAAEVEAVLAPAFEADRLSVHYGAELGNTTALETLGSKFDAVFLGMGLSGSVSLGQGSGIVDALGFLRAAKSGTWEDMPNRVAVLGGGNTAMDAALTALQKGARDVYVVYRRSFAEMPAWPRERDAFLDAGGHLLILTQPVGYQTDEDGHVTAVQVVRTELGEEDASGRRSPVEVAGSESLLHVDLVVEAIGQRLAPPLLKALDALSPGDNGLIEVRPGSQRTCLDNVFAGGDMVRGAATAVQGIVDGMQAAREIHHVCSQ